jgi:hypothetical protein
LDRCGVVITERKPSALVDFHLLLYDAHWFNSGEFKSKHITSDLPRLLQSSSSTSTADASVTIRKHSIYFTWFYPPTSRLQLSFHYRLPQLRLQLWFNTSNLAPTILIMEPTSYERMTFHNLWNLMQVLWEPWIWRKILVSWLVLWVMSHSFQAILISVGTGDKKHDLTWLTQQM